MKGILRSVLAALVLALANLVASSVQASSPVTLTPGIYYSQDVVTSATPINGGTCPNAVGDLLVQWVTYPGPKAAGYTVRQALSFEGTSGMVIFSNFSKTPPAGTATWNTNANYVTYLNGAVYQTGTNALVFETTVTDPYSYYGKFTATISVSGTQVCQEVIYYSAVFTGIP